MDVSYDVFTDNFLQKITEYELSELASDLRASTVDGYLVRALSEMARVCKDYFSVDIDEENRTVSFGGKAVSWKRLNLIEMANIISEGMITQWLKPYVNRQENLENVLNTRDFTTYSPSELLYRVGERYKASQKEFKQKVYEYTYAYGDLTRFHI